ncbi:MAG: hypothetical protein ACT4P9_03170 [Betaproteobacteria bacterium]
MKTRHKVLSAFLVIALLAIGGTWWLLFSLDGLVKQAIERWGPEITGVSVKVQSVRIEVAEGRGAIRGLVLGNPKGFQSPQALKLAEMRLTLDPASIAQHVVVIKELLIVAPEVTYERGQGSDNMTVIQRNVDAWVAANAGKAKSDGPGRKFVIENLRVQSGKAHLGTTLSLPMPDLHLRDVGKKTNGASAGEVVKQVWGSMLRGVTGLASKAGTAIKDGWNRLFK